MLRGLAAFAVVLFHVRVTMWIGLRALAADPGYGWFNRISALITLPFPLFGSAVMLFFVVSGFAIHYPYAGAGRPFTLRSYGARRLFRIYPPYLAAVVFTLIIESFAGVPGGAPSPWSKAMATLTMTQNYVPPPGQLSANPSLWSLPVEAELYLMYPLLLWFWRRVGTARMLACVALTSFAGAAALLGGHEWPMGNFAKYWIIWVSGAVLAERLRAGTLPRWRRSYAWLAAAGLAAAIASRASGVPFGFEHFIWGGLYVLLVWWGLSETKSVTIVPSSLRRPIAFLGDISYSLYLVHYPVLVAAGALWIAAFGGKPVNVAVPLIASLLPLPVAYLSWRFIERPSQEFGRALSQPRPATLPAPAPATAR